MGYVSHIVFPNTFVKPLIFQVIYLVNHYLMLHDHTLQTKKIMFIHQVIMSYYIVIIYVRRVIMSGRLTIVNTRRIII
jgi:hypothetical protein